MMCSRMDDDLIHQNYMDHALRLAQRAAESGEVPVGAVVVFNNKIIGEGWNQPIQNHDPSAHAEIMALRAAAKYLGNYRLVGADLYVTLEPCLMCMGAMFHARIAHCYFGASDPKTGAAGSAMNLVDSDLNFHLSIYGGLLADDCGQLLTDFFRQRRAQNKAIKQKTAKSINAKLA